MEDPSDDNSFNVPELHALTHDEEKATKRGVLHSLKVNPGAIWFMASAIILVIFPWQVCTDPLKDTVTTSATALVQQCQVVWFYGINSFFHWQAGITHFNVSAIFILSAVLGGFVTLLYYLLLYKKSAGQ